MSESTRKHYRFGNDLNDLTPQGLVAEVAATEELLAMLDDAVAKEGESDPTLVTQGIRILLSKWSEAPYPPSPIKVCAIGAFLDVEATAYEDSGNTVLALIYDQLWHEWEWWARACGTELVEFGEQEYEVYNALYPQVAEGKSAADIVREALSARA